MMKRRRSETVSGVRCNAYEQRAIFDLVWPSGVQEELTEPVAVLLGESGELISMASAAGFRCFTSTAAFKSYVEGLNAPNTGLAAE